jgi:ferredoxin
MGNTDKLEITVDRNTCIGDGMCCNDAPETFEMDDEQIAIVKKPPGDAPDSIVEAARNCPVEAIKIVDTGTGKQLYPEG